MPSKSIAPTIAVIPSRRPASRGPRRPDQQSGVTRLNTMLPTFSRLLSRRRLRTEETALRIKDVVE